MTSRLQQTINCAGAGALLALQLFVLLPLTLYLGNHEEFTVPFVQLLQRMASPALFLTLALGLIGFLSPRRLAARLAALVSALTILTWLQGNLLVWNYGLLDGSPIDWDGDRWRGWLDGALWCVVLLGAIASTAVGRACGRVALALSVVAVLAASVLVVDRRADLAGDMRIGEDMRSELMRFSSTRNVLHIIADGMQSDVFAQIVDGDPQIAASMPGFLAFPRHMGAYLYTHMSVPALLSGRLYRNQVPRDEFLEASLGRDGPSILNAASRAGFDIDLAVTHETWPLYTRGAADNPYLMLPDLPGALALHEAATLLDLTLFRAAPHHAKRVVYDDGRWRVRPLLALETGPALQSFAHAAFVRDLVAAMRADREVPVYKLMHLMVSHQPMVTTPDCRYAGKVLPTERGTVLVQAHCGLREIAKLFRRMQELGIYDSATIVLMGDHGAWTPPAGLDPERFRGDAMREAHPLAVAQAMAMFAVKPPGSTGPLRNLEAPSWIVDTAPTIAAMAGIEGQFEGRNALELDDGEPRDRRFLRYRFHRSEWNSNYLPTIREFRVDGRVDDMAAWSLQAEHVGGSSAAPTGSPENVH